MRNAIRAFYGGDSSLMKHLESQHQIAFVEWCSTKRLSELKHPVLPGTYLVDYLFHPPNGGKRNAKEAARFKREGVKKGVEDIFIDIACSGYHGLRIEFKSERGAPRPEQKEWMAKHNRGGYLAAVCRSVDEAIDLTTAYMANERNICESLKYQ